MPRPGAWAVKLQQAVLPSAAVMASPGVAGAPPSGSFGAMPPAYAGIDRDRIFQDPRKLAATPPMPTSPTFGNLPPPGVKAPPIAAPGLPGGQPVAAGQPPMPTGVPTQGPPPGAPAPPQGLRSAGPSFTPATTPTTQQPPERNWFQPQRGTFVDPSILPGRPRYDWNMLGEQMGQFVGPRSGVLPTGQIRGKPAYGL